jgi:1,4-alpha-glucan branching enzyme
LEDSNAIGQDILQGFREFNDADMIEIITGAATPRVFFRCWAADESIGAEIKTGAATHRKHLGRPPRGMWVPECGSPAPAGVWQTPVIPARDS